MRALLVNPERNGIVLRPAREDAIRRRAADPVHRETMRLLAVLNRCARQRSCNTVRRPRQIPRLDEEFLHVRHNRAAHPLLHTDVRRQGRRMEHWQSRDGERGSDRERSLNAPQRSAQPNLPHDLLCCQKEFSYHSIALPSLLFSLDHIPKDGNILL